MEGRDHIFMSSVTTRVQPLQWFSVVMASYLADFLINHGKPLEYGTIMIKMSCFLWRIHKMKLDPKRLVQSKKCGPMICTTVLPLIQSLEVFMTYRLPVMPIPIHPLILDVPMSSHLDRLINSWLAPRILKCQRLRCSRSFNNPYFDVISLRCNTSSWDTVTRHNWGDRLKKDCKAFN